METYKRKILGEKVRFKKIKRKHAFDKKDPRKKRKHAFDQEKKEEERPRYRPRNENNCNTNDLDVEQKFTTTFRF